MNSQAQALIREFEACKLAAYQDLSGRWTAGWGETSGVGPGTLFTQEQANAKLDARIENLDEELRRLSPGLTVGQYGALISLFYNAGSEEYAKSTLRVLIRSGAWFNATRQFLAWDHARLGGWEREVKGLLRRRLAEAQVFVEGSPG